MSALATLLAKRGIETTGADRDLSTPNIAFLESIGIKCFPDDGSGVDGTVGQVVVSTAIEASNPGLLKAKALGIPVVHRAKALAAAPGDPAAVKAFSVAESGLAGVLSRLMVVVERYPDLKADKQMARVMEELTSTENRIAFARQAYNDSVTEYNTKRELFPSSIVAGIFNFAPAALLESTDSAAQREAPQVKF